MVYQNQTAFTTAVINPVSKKHDETPVPKI